MLPAISADLPAYLVPPSSREVDSAAAQNAGFGPSAEVSLSAEQALARNSAQPGRVEYGRDGRFVETAARRDLEGQPAGDQPPAAARRGEGRPGADIQATSGETRASATREDSRGEEPSTARETGRDASRAASLLHSAADSTQETRDLSLKEFDAAIPPAAREELRALAERVSRRAHSASLSADDYRQLSRLFERLGRYDQSFDALARAEELERGGSDDRLARSEDSRESALAAATA